MLHGADLLDPRHYAAARRPALEAETLPPWCYTSQAFYDLEVERIFRRVWNFIGRLDHIPNSGDYFALDLVGVPLIVVRTETGDVRAFANTCRHRGTTLVEGEGHCRAFKCPYHSWVYGLDGRLRSAPEMDETKGFDPAAYGLIPVKLETCGGFAWVNLDPRSASLAEYLGDFPEWMAPYAFGDMVCVRRRAYDIRCNWKLWVENAKEQLHIGTVHRKTINKYASAEVAGYAIEKVRGEYILTAAKHEGSMALLKGDAGFPKIPTLAGKSAEGTLAPLVYPGTYLGCTIDCMWYLEILPRGPDRMTMIHGACFPKPMLDRPDFEAIARNYYKRWDITSDEDILACEWQQRGVASPLARPGRFSHREALVHAIDNWVLDRVLGPAR